MTLAAGIGRKPGCSEVKELAVRGAAITLGNGFDVWKQPKAVWSSLLD